MDGYISNSTGTHLATSPFVASVSKTSSWWTSAPSSQYGQPLWQEVMAAAAIGVLSHHGFYKRGEHHMEAPLLMWLHIILFFTIIYIKVHIMQAPHGFFDAIIISAGYLTALITSIVTYRIFFHRLRRFPGPVLASTTKLWQTAQCFGCKNHLLIDKLHEEYGDFVRTGPTELTIFKPEVKMAIDGPLNKCTKAVWYDILLPLAALNTVRSKPSHDERRRAWDQAVTKKAIDRYEKRIEDHVFQLEKHIENSVGQTVDVTEWFYFLSFDVMGDFAFAKTFDMLKTKEWHYAVLLLRRAMSLLGPFSSVPWLAQIAFSLPFIPVIRDWNNMLSWCGDRMAEQVAERSDSEDQNISSVLIQHSEKKHTLKGDAHWLRGDAVALIVAGSDTVASAMVYFFYRMALHPEHADKIREELKTLSSVSDTEGLIRLHHLNGSINEVLRLHPSVPTGGYRETPPEGMEIAGTYVPGNVTIVAPRYTMNRLEESFKYATEFIPERWYSKPELVADRSSFNPFSLGRYSCVGKKLALAEIRFTAALLLSKYDVTFAPGSDPSTALRDMRDQFTAVPGKLDMVFQPLQ